MKQSGENYKRIVVKLGSSLFYPERGGIDLSRFNAIVEDIARLRQNEGKEIVVVSSGAIALGVGILNLKSRPRELPYLQAAAAVGQNALMDNYSGFFKKFKLNCSQILLTWDDFDSRMRYLNARNTLLTLLKLKSIPIINENDSVSTEEIKFGDNDRLSALVASLISAHLLIILSDVDGLLDKDKKLIKLIDGITPRIQALACPTQKKTCVGGMVTKLQAAKIAVDSGIPCVIANGKREHIITDIIKAPSGIGNWSLFVPKKGLAERKRWIAFGTKPKGRVVVDEGAKSALLDKKSLLSVGVVDRQGVFDAQDIVSIIDKQGNEFARGKICLSYRELDKVKGRRSDKEVVHCDNIVVIQNED